MVSFEVQNWLSTLL